MDIPNVCLPPIYSGMNMSEGSKEKIVPGETKRLPWETSFSLDVYFPVARDGE